MDTHHYLGFKRLAGRGLRYIVSYEDFWLGLAAWQNGAFKCAPRDRWVGWKPKQQFQRLNMVANNTRFLILSDPGLFPNLASHFLAGMTRRLSDDWQDAYGHGVLIAETFCDPAKFPGTMYRAAGWECRGQTKGFARANGRYTNPHGKPKDIFVKPLRSDARDLLSSPNALPHCGRKPGYPGPPAQIRTCALTHPAPALGHTVSRRLGHGCRTVGVGQARVINPSLAHSVRSFCERLRSARINRRLTSSTNAASSRELPGTA